MTPLIAPFNLGFEVDDIFFNIEKYNTKYKNKIDPQDEFMIT